MSDATTTETLVLAYRLQLPGEPMRVRVELRTMRGHEHKDISLTEARALRDRLTSLLEAES